MAREQTPGRDSVRTAEVIATLCLATDLGMGFPLEHGLRSTLVATRVARRLGVDDATTADVYYGCLLFYAGCTVDAEISAELFDEGALLKHFTPVMFGSPSQTLAGIFRALGDPASPRLLQLVQGATRLPRAARGHQRHITAMCEVARMLSAEMGLPASVQSLFRHFTERWDGHGLHRVRGDQLPLALRIIHVARDAAFQAMLGGWAYAAGVVRQRAGHAFDPAIAGLVADEAVDLLGLDDGRSVWHDVLDAEPAPWVRLDGAQIDRALAAMGSFADLVSPFLVGHSAGAAELAGAAAQQCGLSPDDVTQVRRAGHVHDLGRVAIHAGTWQKDKPLAPDEWERVRLHAYYTERVLCRSAHLAGIAPVAGAHQERLDGSGYHRGATAAALPMPARLLAAADAYHAMTEPRPFRPRMAAAHAAEQLRQEVRAGRLDADAVRAVLVAAGQTPRSLPRPAGLTDREAQVVTLLARGLQTKQIGRALGISPKTADRHVQNAYAKIGVSTRAAAAVFAMQHGLVGWGEHPMVTTPRPS